MTNSSIETYSGRWFDVLEPKLEQIDIESIAHALSMLCRFTGHVRHFYSVGQHSLLGSLIIPQDYALEFLLHDAAESYLGDMSRPLKHCTAAGQAYRQVEEVVSSVIRLKFGLPSVQSDVIHEYDNMMLYAEKEQLMGKLEWSDESSKAHECPDRKVAPVLITEKLPWEIEIAFLNRFKQLTGE
jgi:uncharacterized protein